MRPMIALALSLCAAAPTAAHAQTTPFKQIVLNHQGLLLDPQDAPITGTIALHFGIYPTALPPENDPNQTPLWEDDFADIQVFEGRYSLVLGDSRTGNEPIEIADLATEEPRYLGISVNGSAELRPRMRIAFSPTAIYAHTAAHADAAADLECAVAGCVGEADLGAGAVTAAKLGASSVEAGSLAANAVTELKLAANAVTEAKLGADAVTAAKIKDGEVGEPELAANAVTAAKIRDGEVGEAELAANAVTDGKIAAGAVTGDKIGAGAVGNVQLDATAGFEAVGTAQIQAGAVTTAKLASGAIDFAHVQGLVGTGAQNLAAGNHDHASKYLGLGTDGRLSGDLAADRGIAFRPGGPSEPANDLTDTAVIKWQSYAANSSELLLQVTNDTQDRIHLAATGGVLVDGNLNVGSITSNGALALPGGTLGSGNITNVNNTITFRPGPGENYPTDPSDTAEIKFVAGASAGISELVLEVKNDSNDNIRIKTTGKVIIEGSDVELPCPSGYWKLAGGRRCMESSQRSAAQMYNGAIEACRGIGARVCGWADYQLACSAGQNPFTATSLWYGDNSESDDYYHRSNGSACDVGNGNDWNTVVWSTSLPYRCCL